MKRAGGLGIALLLLCVPAASAQARDATAELRGLGPAARLQLPALARLVDEAEALARDGELDPDRLYRRRYGRLGPSRREVRRDQQALAEALEALWLMERAAARRGRSRAMLRGLHRQLLAAINRGYAVAGRELETTRSRVPRLDPIWRSGRSYPELFAGTPRTAVARLGVSHAAVMLLVALAESARAALPAEGALSAGRFVETLAFAGAATTYRLGGREQGSGRTYEGWATLQEDGGRLVLTVRRGDDPPLRAPLRADGRVWRLEADVRRGTGLAGRLTRDEARALRLQAEYRRAEPGRIEGTWRLLAGERVVARGREELARDAPEGAPADEVEPLLAQSPLFASIVAACREVVDEGTVPADLLVTTANRADPRVLLEGPAIFAEHARLIAGAKREVLYQALTFDPDSEAGQRILGALRELADRRADEPQLPPVRVRLVINSFWGRDFGMDATRRAVEALELDPRGVDVRVVGHGHLLRGGLHSKTLVVDGRRGLVTGANPEAVHDAQPLPWFDAGFRVDGRAAEALRADFNQLWHKVTDAWLPPLERPAEPSGAAPGGRTPVLVATRRATGEPFQDSVADPQGQAFVTAIRSAERLVRIHTPNLNDDAIRRAILAAVLDRGVRVQLVLPYGFNGTGAQLMGGSNRSSVDALHRAVAEAGGEAAGELLRIRWYGKKDGSGRSVGNEPGAAHTKYASFDGQVGIVGSGNLDTQAMNHSREVNLVVDDARVVRAWDAQHFEPSWRRGIPTRPAEPAIDRPLGEPADLR